MKIARVETFAKHTKGMPLEKVRYTLLLWNLLERHGRAYSEDIEITRVYWRMGYRVERTSGGYYIYNEIRETKSN